MSEEFFTVYSQALLLMITSFRSTFFFFFKIRKLPNIYILNTLVHRNKTYSWGRPAAPAKCKCDVGFWVSQSVCMPEEHFLLVCRALETRTKFISYSKKTTYEKFIGDLIATWLKFWKWLSVFSLVEIAMESKVCNTIFSSWEFHCICGVC